MCVCVCMRRKRVGLGVGLIDLVMICFRDGCFGGYLFHISYHIYIVCLIVCWVTDKIIL